MAPGTRSTFDPCPTQSGAHQEPHNPMPEFLQNYQAETPFMLDKAKLLKNLKCARRGAAAGPSSMTADHLKVVLENHRDSDLFHNICLLVRAAVPREIFSAIRIGRLTALQKVNLLRRLGRAPRLVPPICRMSEKTSGQGRGARPRSQGSPGSGWVAQFGGPTCKSVGRASTTPNRVP